ncbi:MAG TPA: protoglobin domain-containing protein, partial [Ktedonobacteraceae bacterium]|nr:protoglobin domain-containing protein [Ktedonobacteraceae bacterium]
QEIALRHTRLKKNTTDRVESAPFIPLRYILAFAAVINETTKPYLAAHGHEALEVEKMHRAWCKSVQLQVTLWSQPYTSTTLAPNEW